ncbi:MAG: hypothetical protein WCS03_19350 [Bacteroidota bacterium]
MGIYTLTVNASTDIHALPESHRAPHTKVRTGDDFIGAEDKSIIKPGHPGHQGRTETKSVVNGDERRVQTVQEVPDSVDAGCFRTKPVTKINTYESRKKEPGCRTKFMQIIQNNYIGIVR